MQAFFVETLGFCDFTGCAGFPLTAVFNVFFSVGMLVPILVVMRLAHDCFDHPRNLNFVNTNT